MGTKKNFLRGKKFFWGKNEFFWKKNEKKILGKISEKKFFFDFFNIIVPYFDSNRFFQAKSLSYNVKLLLGLLLVQFQKIWWNRFYANSKKLWFWAKMAIFQHIWPKSAKMRNFIKNRAVLFFYPYCPPNFMPSFRKIVRAVSEINSLRTYIGETIEPVAFAGSTSVPWNIKSASF